MGITPVEQEKGIEEFFDSYCERFCSYLSRLGSVQRLPCFYLRITIASLEVHAEYLQGSRR